MSKEKIILILGVWVAVLPYLGFPYFLKNILFSITGLGIVFLGYLLLKDSGEGKEENKEIFDNFSENVNFEEKSLEKVQNSDFKDIEN